MQDFSIKNIIWYIIVVFVCVGGIFLVTDTWSHNYEISLTEPTRNFIVKEVREENGIHFVTLQGVTQEKSVTLQRNIPWNISVGNQVGATWNCFFQRFQLATPEPIQTDNLDDDDWWWMMNIMNFSEN